MSYLLSVLSHLPSNSQWINWLDFPWIRQSQWPCNFKVECLIPYALKWRVRMAQNESYEFSWSNIKIAISLNLNLRKELKR